MIEVSDTVELTAIVLREEAAARRRERAMAPKVVALRAALVQGRAIPRLATWVRAVARWLDHDRRPELLALAERHVHRLMDRPAADPVARRIIAEAALATSEARGVLLAGDQASDERVATCTNMSCGTPFVPDRRGQRRCRRCVMRAAGQRGGVAAQRHRRSRA